MSSLRLAGATALNRAPEHRVRLVAMVVSSTVFTVLMLSVLSVLHLVHSENVRASSRQPQISRELRSTDAYAKSGRDLWGDRRIDLVWVQPAGGPTSRTTALAPGMDHFPEPGESYVSPALDRLAAVEPGVARRYPRRSVLNDAGVASGDDLIAYVRPRRNRPIGELDSAYSVVGGHAHGSGPVVRYSRLGLAVTDRVPLPQVAIAAFALVLGPGLVLMAVGLSAASTLRERRLRLLEALGARRRSVVWLSALEALVLTAPLAAVLGAIWAALSPQVTRLPLVGLPVVRGDLGAGPALVALGVVGELVVVAGFSAAMSSFRRSRQLRPTSETVTLSISATIPIFLAGICFAAVPYAGSSLSGTFKLIGTAAGVAGAPLVVPGLVRSAGDLLSRVRAPVLSLAGRSIEWSPKRVSRPAIGAAALLTVFLAVAGFVAASRDVEDVPDAALAAPAVVAVQWHHAQAADLPELRGRAPGLLWAPFRGDASAAHRESDHDHGDGDHLETVVLGMRCADLHRILEVRCPGSPYELPEDVAAVLRSKASVALGHEVAELRLGPPPAPGQEGRVLALSSGPAAEADATVRDAATAVLPGPLITSVVNQRVWQSEVVGWIWSAQLSATFVLVLACLIALVDRVVATTRQLDQLQTIGMSAGQLRIHQAATFLVPYAASVLIGTADGLVLCLVWVSGAPFPVGSLVTALSAALGLGAVATTGVALLGHRVARTVD